MRNNDINVIDIKNHKAVIDSKGTFIERDEILAVERALQIVINNIEFSMTMQTPGAERYLIRGLLFAENIANLPFKSFKKREAQNGTIVKVRLDFDNSELISRRFNMNSACGVCGKESLKNLYKTIVPVNRKSILKLDVDIVNEFYASMYSYQKIFQQTGGVHAAGAINSNGELIAVFEDVGRHNAVDKVIGYLLEQALLSSAEILIVSSRVSFEIVQKCANAKIPVLIAISAPSSLSVKMAKKAGIKLLAFCKKDRMTYYNGYE
ncbi:formate dehydrogenase accessory sulfurtransferase FdhD [Francisella sp. 19X1-34]|uniref:formate dehydrogenase accessory sulfurtransferase FdhD n=1 Tax=Francisella sp. 19X1-34 TaxID=3087177 RepID=UPI002E34E4FD|nr:formate dehydrogenase accessory sulfurtransferase FdhD [Francisella sp. 19X1-34]MED7788614.1 formate dehydrogenase accessory sulfurtransferase FdhD [Francisella sp. 19X1-34]